MAEIALTDELVALEVRAWEEIQAGGLTLETAQAVQAAITAHAAASGQGRYEVEKALKVRVRHPVEPEGEQGAEGETGAT
ncbi:hypothetical protein [Streptomyces sp. NPDC048057]|uniref:hypothetical protein n=1 Tax=Streptomyces sp. NPDC048057 TaxID=3155628 RepID=UPI003402D7B9